MEAIIERLEGILARYNEITELMMSSEVLSDNRQMAKLGKEQAGLAQLVETYLELKTVLTNLEEAEILMKENDRDLREMAEMEIEENEPRKVALLDKLEVLLIPKDPYDDGNAIIEIRGAAGGDEGNIFAGDLYRMYSRYAEIVGWKVEVLDLQEAEAGGFSLISFMVKGDGVYGRLRFESGSHRVQRVPKTESQGRIHTSTATVLVSPEVEAEDVEIDPKDLEIDTLRASGAGGQHVNKTDSAVRITHIPTGIAVKCQDGRSQHDNRDKAMKLLRAKIYDARQAELEAQAGAERKSKIGTGDRAEKIRTYNYPQNRVTDHRIGLTINQLDRIMDGKLVDVLDGLQAEDQKQKLAGNQA